MSTVITVWLVVALAALVAVHLALVYGLVRRRPRYRALFALLVPPLAPYWGWDTGMRRRALLWVCALAAYAVGVGLASI